ncbi:CBASS cGAMP-activated phospholipase [Paracoccus beibuensis]|uniref:CBASS cGAMP-activated phospholipase n=1 Tax=Paracoccus beibuensis TaxID=547602 RepID=UPI002240B74C|nr:CBASS cGAMP-activated phospholipase [Paracoccus beibuensis]
MTFQILSLSGGGYLGLYTAAVLAEIEQRSERKLIDCFDLIAGTSIGGIIALGLSAGRTATEIRDAFLESGPKVFNRTTPKTPVGEWLRFARRVPAPLYDPKSLRAIIDEIVGSKCRMSELHRPVTIPAVNLTKGGPKIFKTGHHKRFILDWKLLVSDVAMATSAAPTYFPAHVIGNELFADGGLFANSPDMIALHEAEEFLNVHRDRISILSVGTTTTDFAMSSDLNPKLGAFGWMRNNRLTDVMIGSQQAITNDMMIHRLKGRYLRIDRRQADAQKRELALDVATPAATKNLMAMAASSFAEVTGDPRLIGFLEHTAPKFDFINSTI